MTVHFQVIEGGGSLSRTTATSNNEGRASVSWTMGPNTGNNRMRITVAENSGLSATATATSSEYYCPEEDPAFSAKFSPAGNLMMLTRTSSLTAGSAGLVRYALNTGGANVTFTGNLLQTYADSGFQKAVSDCVFAANGDLFLAWYGAHDEIVKAATNGDVTHFATLEPAPIDGTQGAELAMTPDGALMGCDARGPFYATCRDSVFRFEGAIFTGSDLNRDACNTDALACDPATGDLYFIYKQDRTLRQIHFPQGITGAPTITEIATLIIDASDGAKGMIVDGSDHSVYIVVDYQTTTKSIVKVTIPGGVVSTAYDFFNRGAGDAAGIQEDLALDRQSHNLFTLDTKNNVFLAFGLTGSGNEGSLVSIAPLGDPFQASNSGFGDAVGLDVIPAAGP
jgi:hypothetical protein